MTAVLSLVPTNLDADAVAIGNLYRKACSSLVESANYYIAAGRALIEKKEELPHGEWLPWLKANADVLGFASDRTAQLLMKQAANAKLTSDLDEAGALQVSRKMWGNTPPYRTIGTGETEWHTPPEYVDAARDVLGSIDCDPASNAVAQETVRAKKYFTKENDGLNKKWHGKVWLNPPYTASIITDFVEKLIAEINTRRVTEAIMLTHNNTDTGWFHRAAVRADAICFTRGRVKFENPDGDLATAPNGQAFFYFGTEPLKFATRFEDIGTVFPRALKLRAGIKMTEGS